VLHGGDVNDGQRVRMFRVVSAHQRERVSQEVAPVGLRVRRSTRVADGGG
jgi:hypothetical protein